jgi:hypothetical protein
MSYSIPSIVKCSLAALMGAVILVCGLWLLAYTNSTKNGKVFDLNGQPHIEDVNGNRVSQLRAGDGIVLVYPVHRYPKKCWAEYIDMLDGPVSHQFRANRSMVFSDVAVDVTFHKYHDLPDHLPAGRYKVSLLIFPVCDGFDIQPYRIESGIFLDIVE